MRGTLRQQSERRQFLDGFAEGRAVAQVAAGHHDEIGRVPIHQVEQVEDGGLLPLDAEGIDGVQKVDAGVRLAHQGAQRVVEVALDVLDLRAEIEGLRQLGHRRPAARQVHAGAQIAARRVGRHGGRGVAGGRAGHRLRALACGLR
jgi:hypothetical protein